MFGVIGIIGVLGDGWTLWLHVLRMTRIGPEPSQFGDDLVPQRVDSTAAGQGLSRQGVQTLDSGGHAASRDPLDLCNRPSALLRGDLCPIRQIPLMSRLVGLGKFGVLGQPLGHLRHESRGLQPADERSCTWTGEVVGRREGTAIGQSRLGGDHPGASARTAPSDTGHGTRLTSQLVAHGGDVCGCEGLEIHGCSCPSVQHGTGGRRLAQGCGRMAADTRSPGAG